MRCCRCFSIWQAKITVDLQTTEYLDSSAMGMLLILREQAGGDGANIKIVNCSPEIKKILSVSNFEQMFQIS